MNELTIDGVVYTPKTPDAGPANRHVIVVDRGWIWAGDLDETSVPGRLIISRVTWVRNWSSVGFDGVIHDPGSSNVILRQLVGTVNIPAGAEVFRVPVSDYWGVDK